MSSSPTNPSAVSLEIPKSLMQKYSLFILLFLYFLSGMVSLSYEVLWARMLSLQFGVSIFGVVVTIAAFMLGLGLGSLVTSAWLRRISQPLLIFALLEAIIALFSLLMPWALNITELDSMAASFAGDISSWYMLQFFIIGMLLLLPAFLMGAGFPIVLKALNSNADSLGKIYGINAAGAAIGALLPLILLPSLGWLVALQVVALIGILIAVCALVLNFSCHYDDEEELINEHDTIQAEHSQAECIINSYMNYAAIGCAAIMLEVAWIRLFGMLLLRTEYVLAIILCVFLLGIGFGSVIARYIKQQVWLTVLPITASVFILLSLWVLPYVSNWAHIDGNIRLGSLMFRQGFLILLLTLPATLVMGAWLPLLTRRFGDNAKTGSTLYGVNSVGSALGAILAGFILTPLIGTSATIVLSAMIILGCGLYWSPMQYKWAALPISLLVALPVMSMPNVSQLLPNIYRDTVDLYYHEDAISITHVVRRIDGQRMLLSDLQRMDASSEPIAVEVQKNQARLPLLLHRKPNSVLFLGLGTGISAAGALAYPNLQKKAVEISQGAIDAARDWFSVVNDDVVADMTVVRDDARRFLMTDDQFYDVIIGDLFHPDLVGRSALLSVQQFQRAANRLNDDGVFVQWIALNQFDIQAFDTVIRSFNQVFPHAVLFVDAFRIALVGPKSSPILANHVLDNFNRLSESDQHLATGGEGVWSWLGRYWGAYQPPKGMVQDEWAPQIEFHLPKVRYSGELDLAMVLNYVLRQRPNMQESVEQLGLSADSVAAFERAYAATDLAHRSWLAMLTKRGDEGQRLLRLAYTANPMDRWIAFAVADAVIANLDAYSSNADQRRTILQSVLKVRADHPEALRLLWQLEKNLGNKELARDYRDRLAVISPLESMLENSQE